MVEEKREEILKRMFPQEFNKRESEAYDKLGIQKLKPVIKSFKEQKKLNQALVRACEKGNVEKVQELINNGANINAKKNGGWTALHVASILGRDEIVKLLLEKGVKINAPNKEGGTALYYASLLGNEKTVELLLEKGANPNTHNKKRETPLHSASYLGRDEIVKLLLEKGADIHAKNETGMTALHHATAQKQDKTVKLLLEHAEKQGEIEKLLNAVNDKGERAVDIAKGNVREMLRREMRKHGLKI